MNIIFLDSITIIYLAIVKQKQKIPQLTNRIIFKTMITVKWTNQHYLETPSTIIVNFDLHNDKMGHLEWA